MIDFRINKLINRSKNQFNQQLLKDKEFLMNNISTEVEELMIDIQKIE